MRLQELIREACELRDEIGTGVLDLVDGEGNEIGDIVLEFIEDGKNKGKVEVTIW